MEKKDIYEHLARIYLDASLKYKKKKNFPRSFLWLTTSLAILLVTLLILSTHNFIFFQKNKLNYKISLDLIYDPVKINFNLNPIKREVLTLSLNGLDLGNFKILSFKARKSDFTDDIYLRIEFDNAFRESSSVYISGILTKWKEFKIDLKDFKEISNWDNMNELRFIVEEWNTQTKSGKLYIDEIKLLK